jgi:hypothetical protein
LAEIGLDVARSNMMLLLRTVPFLFKSDLALCCSGISSATRTNIPRFRSSRPAPTIRLLWAKKHFSERCSQGQSPRIRDESYAMPTAEEAADMQYTAFFNADELLAAPYAGLRQQATLRMSFSKVLYRRIVGPDFCAALGVKRGRQPSVLQVTRTCR